MYMFNLCYKHTCVTDKLLLDLVAGHSQLQAYKWDARVCIWVFLNQNSYWKFPFIQKISWIKKEFNFDQLFTIKEILSII